MNKGVTITMNVNQSMDQSELVPIVSTLYKQFQLHGDITQSKKALDLLGKLQSEEFVMGFAGHFSAGKSTLINTLIGEQILPSSPIPTSANLVKVKNGREYARVYFTEEDPIEIEQEYDLNTIQSFCKDGEAVREIEISKPLSSIPDGVSVMDTPGIDSSNDADRLMTESALHMVDVLFYVMDYNHVQSEVNLAFLAEMKKRGKPLYIVVNQIDKHQEEELSFTSFKESVHRSLEIWGIKPEGVYFTSLFNLNLTNNDFRSLQQDVNMLIQQKQDVVHNTVHHSMKSIVQEHLETYKQQKNTIIEEAQLKLERLEPSDIMAVEEVQQEKARMENRPEDSEETMLSELQSTLNNAYVMSHDLREHARSFVESMDSGFKVGFIMTKKKTEEEREERLNTFYEALVEKVKANMEWPVRNKLLTVAKDYQVFDEDVLQDLQNLTITLDREDLKYLIKTGAGSGGDYILVYTKDVVNDLKQRYKKQALTQWEAVKQSIQNQTSHEIEEKEKLERTMREYEQIKKEMEEEKQAIEKRKDEYSSIINGEEIWSSAYDEATEALIHRDTKIHHVEWIEESQKENKAPDPDKTYSQKNTSSTTSLSIESAIEAIKQAKDTLHDVHGFATILNELEEKKARLQSRHYTVALFGAFSAGKSSFANALLGEKVLPVSPNPTTATINRIMPSTDEYGHGSVEVKVKSESQLIEDIQFASGKHTLKSNTLTKVVEELNDLMQQGELSSIDQNRLSFINAIKQGYSFMKDYVGQTIMVDLDKFAAYVSDETRSCFVEWMNLYYDCPLTSRGITLVDTPGADSVNARHTEVSFEYMKQADAILFVTYYNHAFSRADQDFLYQLGRVKDAFSMDKMFFLINAADLAQNQQDLQLVTDYMGEQLTQFGIRNPRLYPVSSLMAMQEKEESSQVAHHPVLPSSGIDYFEDAFTHFMDEEITGLLVHEIVYDLHRASNMIQHMIESASLSKEAKQERKKHIKQQLSKTLETIGSVDTTRYEQSIKQKIDKQTYYIQERLLLRFTDFFKEHINPSSINGNSKQAKQQLESAVSELLEQLASELKQEVRAVSIRIESFLNEIVSELKDDLQEQTQRIITDLSLPNAKEKSYETPQIQEPFQHIKPDYFEKEINLFKNTKAFFENNEKETMKEALQVKIKPLLGEYILGQKESLVEYYLAQWQEHVSMYKKQIMKSIEEYEEGVMYSLQDDISIETLRDKKEYLDNQLLQDTQ